MRRYLMVATAAAALAGMTLGAPAYAVTGIGGDQQQQVIKHAVQAVQTAELDHNFQTLKSKALGVFIVPSYKEGSLIVGASGGEGVLLVRENDTWSPPAFYSLGSISVGAQAGGQAGSVIMLLMTKQAVRAFEEANNFSLNAKAGLTVANYSTKAQTGTNQDDVVVWSQTNGAEGGVSVSGSKISQDLRIDRQYYGQNVDTAQILEGKVNNLSSEKLRNALRG